MTHRYAACLVLGLALLAGACSQRPEAETAAASPGAFTLRGQVPIAQPPGTRDATEKVRRDAAQRCPSGFVIRSLHTSPPANATLVDRLISYDAVVECSATK
jgi:hypothetical protein